jgi:hypothetical protein
MLIRPRELTERVADDRHRHIAALLSAGLRRRLRHSHACQRLAHPHRAPAQWPTERGPAAVERATSRAGPK